jgi:hypothetical protein
MVERVVRSKNGIAVGIMVLALFASRAFADPTAADYGVDGIVVSDEEKAADQKFGGFPNNPLFNNETPCIKVLKLFHEPGLQPDKPDMKAFLTYARVKLMEIDIADSVFKQHPPAITTMDHEMWSVLPALFPQYCRTHIHDKLEDAVAAVYQAATLAYAAPALAPSPVQTPQPSERASAPLIEVQNPLLEGQVLPFRVLTAIRNYGYRDGMVEGFVSVAVTGGTKG